VMFHARGNQYSASIWDPATGTSTDAPLSPYNIYCSSHVFLADGELLITGGHASSGVGLPDATTYNPFTNTWTLLPDMNTARWYPTSTILGNGDVLVVGGSIDSNNGLWALTPEVWQATGRTWRALFDAQLQFPFYPFMFLKRVCKLSSVSHQSRC